MHVPFGHPRATRFTKNKKKQNPKIINTVSYIQLNKFSWIREREGGFFLFRPGRGTKYVNGAGVTRAFRQHRAKRAPTRGAHRPFPRHSSIDRGKRSPRPVLGGGSPRRTRPSLSLTQTLTTPRVQYSTVLYSTVQLSRIFVRTNIMNEVDYRLKPRVKVDSPP